MTQKIEVDLHENVEGDYHGWLNVSRLYEALYHIDPRDRRDATWYMSPATRDELRRVNQSHGDPPRDLDQLMGIPIQLDSVMHEGVVVIEVESPQERTLRRLAKDGVPVVVQQLPPLNWSMTPPPTPTLAGLLKHWLRMVKRRWLS